MGEGKGGIGEKEYKGRARWRKGTKGLARTVTSSPLWGEREKSRGKGQASYQAEEVNE